MRFFRRRRTIINVVSAAGEAFYNRVEIFIALKRIPFYTKNVRGGSDEKAICALRRWEKFECALIFVFVEAFLLDDFINASGNISLASVYENCNVKEMTP